MDLNKMVMNSLAKMESEGKIQSIVDNHIESTINNAIKDVFGQWSDFSKELEKYIKESIQINLKDLDLASYNHLILQAIKDKLDDEITNQGVAQIKSQIEVLLSDTKREYKLSELVEELAQEIEDLDDLDFEESHDMTLHIDNSYNSSWIGLDSRTDIDEYDCKYRILINSNREVCSVKINNKESYTRRNINEFDVKAVLSGLHGLEETLFKIYTNGAKLIVDEESCELEIFKSDD